MRKSDHMLFLDGVYVRRDAALAFRRVKAPSRAEFEAFLERISQRVGQYLERAGGARPPGAMENNILRDPFRQRRFLTQFDPAEPGARRVSRAGEREAVMATTR